jgi:hypothetical protein
MAVKFRNLSFLYGRHAGSRNVWYFYGNGQGWVTQVAESVLDESGGPRTDAKAKRLAKRRLCLLKTGGGAIQVAATHFFNFAHYVVGSFD